jgi:HTH-type transcriptional regulator, pheromone-responsive regulator
VANELNTYGEVVRNIRTNKGLSQKEVYLDIISKSYAIEFEKGNHEITLRLLEQILNRLMMGIDEFFYIYRGYKLSKHDTFTNKYSKAGNNNDLEALIEIYQELHQREDLTSKIHLAEVRSRIRLLKHFNLTGQFEKNVILTEDIETITNYLNNLQSWTLQEMQLFTNTLNYIDYDQRDILFQTLIKSMKKYEAHERGRDVICVMLTNMIYELIMINQISYAEILLENLNNISSPQYQTLFFKIVYKYYNGLIKIKRNSKEEGTKLAQSAIDVLYEFGEPYQAKTLESILSQILQ